MGIASSRLTSGLSSLSSILGEMLAPPPSGGLFLETLTPFILNLWAGCGHPAVPLQSSTLCFKWLFVYLCRHNLEAFSVCCDSSVFLGSSCSCAATSPWLFHKCIQDIILSAVYYCIFRVHTGQMQLRSGGQIWSKLFKKSNLIRSRVPF